MEKSSIHIKIESLQNMLKTNSTIIIIFIATLLSVITVTHPLIFLNDEWITANQLNQLDQGHQFILNEGKYGFLQNGTPNPYFEARNNALMYPIFLPIISLPALKIIKLLGDTFDYWIITIWAILLIILGLMVQKFHNQITIFRKIPLSSLLFILAFVFFFINVALYIPFTIDTSKAPREVAAIVLTNDIIFSGIVVIIFSICKSIFKDRWYVWVSTFTCVASSSYLIWVSSAKDHLLAVFLCSVIIFGFVKFFYTKKIEYCYFSFFFIGLYTWERPEVGIFLFLFMSFSFLYYFLIAQSNPNKKQRIQFIVISIISALLGAIPLFINNYLMTKNPFIPSYATGLNSSSAAPLLYSGTSGILGFFISLSNLILSRVVPNFDTLGNDFARILFLPGSGSSGVFIIAPLFLIGVIILSISWKFKPLHFSQNEKYLAMTLLFLIFANFVAYLNSFNILNTDPAVFPDVRYLSPIYLPLNIIGLIIFSKIFKGIQNRQYFNKYFIVLFCSLSVASIGTISLIRNFNTFSNISLFMLLIVVTVSTVLIILLYLSIKYQTLQKTLIYVFGLLIILPFIWQISMIYVIEYTARLYVGYTYFLPMVRDISYFIFSSLV